MYAHRPAKNTRKKRVRAASDNAQKTQENTRKVQPRVPTQKNTRHLFSKESQTPDDPRIRAIKEYQERQLDDPFKGKYGVSTAANTSEHTILEPPFNYRVLMALPDENNTLKQCIEAMAINIEGFGYRMEYVGDPELRDSEAVLAEKERATALLDTPNADTGFIDVRKKLRVDVETMGIGYLEVMRDTKNQIAAFNHVSSNNVRKTTKDREFVTVNKVIIRNGKQVTIPHRKKFRRYVQRSGLDTVYFKEFGDPRTIDYRTGKELPKPDPTVEATELVCIEQYSPNYNYGVPRWINQLPAIIGSRESEMTNLSFFKDNAIPAMAVLVSGGALTEGSTSALHETFTRKTGVEAQNRIVVLEALGDEEAADAEGRIPPPRIDMRPLSNDRQSDGLFQTYDENNQAKIRSSFRLPPLFLGRAEDYTRATAEASLIIAEAQVFAPERRAIDDMVNHKLLLDENGEPLKYWKFRSNPARMTGASDVLDALETLHGLGAITPNVAIGMANELFDLNLVEITDDWGNYPFNLIMQTDLKNDPDIQNVIQKLESLGLTVRNSGGRV